MMPHLPGLSLDVSELGADLMKPPSAGVPWILSSYCIILNARALPYGKPFGSLPYATMNCEV